MKQFIVILLLSSGFFFFSCITEYEPAGINEIKDILVVEGHITEGKTRITLSKSVNLSDRFAEIFVDDAIVFVECDDGTRIQADDGSRDGRYTIQTAKLDSLRKYRLKIEIAEVDFDSNECFMDEEEVLRCPRKTFEYCSDFSFPLKTPEIDSVFWMKEGKGHPIRIFAATQSPENDVPFYRWSFREDWEIAADVLSYWEEFQYPRICYGSSIGEGLIFGSGEKGDFGQAVNLITEVSPKDRKIERTYRITVYQNTISKRAHDYFANIKKNSPQTDNLFAPTPSDFRGNIICITDPRKPVIGYVDVSFTTQKQLYISDYSIYEYFYRDWDCSSVEWRIVETSYDGYPQEMYVPYEWAWDSFGILYILYINTLCIDCTNFGTTNKPDD